MKEIILHEISVVTFGANEHTEYIGDMKALDDMERYVKALRETAPDEYEKVHSRILSMFKAEPAPAPLTSRSSVFEKLGQIKN